MVVSNKVIGETVLTAAVKRSCEEVIDLLGHLGVNYVHLEEDLEELDLENNVRIVGLYLEERCVGEKDRVLMECMESLQLIIEKIREELRVLHRRMDEHRRLWFSGWRDDGSGEVMRRLRRHKGVLRERWEMFYGLHRL